MNGAASGPDEPTRRLRSRCYDARVKGNAARWNSPATMSHRSAKTLSTPHSTACPGIM